LQVLYGLTEPRWVFPDRWYDFIVKDPAGFSVHFVTIDSQSLRLGINDPPAQLQWLDETLAASTSEWKVVITHHPPYSAGNYGPTDPVIDIDVRINICLFVQFACVTLFIPPMTKATLHVNMVMGRWR